MSGIQLSTEVALGSDLTGKVMSFPPFKRFHTLWLFWYAVLLLWASHVNAVSAKSDQAPELQEREALDLAYQEFVDRWQSASMENNPPPTITGLEQLVEQVRRLPVPQGVALIRANFVLLSDHTGTREFDELLAYLYQANDTASVQRVADQLKKNGDRAALSRNYFLLAQYYEQRLNWQAVQGALSKIDVKSLKVGDNHYYQLLMGYALQNIKDHRKSLQYYQQIPNSSPYFAHAKLNEGTANLRQGWWTEAHIEFERAIQFLTDHPRDDGLRDRLLVVLGYSQLHYEFYRDARNTLRKVAVDSNSANKALMGIGLAAAYQKDFVGAANAFRLLTEKPTADLSVDEAFLLLPYAEEETGNKEMAGLAYQKAISHYQRKSDDLLHLQNQILGADQNLLLKKLQDAETRATEVLGGATAIPAYMHRNFEYLMQMQPLAGEPGLENAAQDLRRRYQLHLQQMTVQNIEARRAMLNSYLSQAKFGMAKLYDAP